MRYRKCVCCGDPILDTDESVPYKNRYAHKRCFTAAVKVLHKKKTGALRKPKARSTSKGPRLNLPDPVDETAYKYKKAYYQTLQTKEGTLPPELYAISEQIRDRHDLSWQDMLRTITYIKKYRHPDKRHGIGLIPFYFEEAKNHYTKVKELNKNYGHLDVTKLYKVQNRQVRPFEKNFKPLKLPEERGDQA